MIDPICRLRAATKYAAVTVPFFACLLASGNSLAEEPRPLFFIANSMGAWKPDAFRASLHPAPARIVCDGDAQVGPIDRDGPKEAMDPWRPEKGDQETAAKIANKWTYTLSDWGKETYVLCYPYGVKQLIGPARDSDMKAHGPVVHTVDGRKDAVAAKERWLIPAGSPIRICFYTTPSDADKAKGAHNGPTICE